MSIRTRGSKASRATTLDYDGFLDMMEQYGHNCLRYWLYSMFTKNNPWSRKSTVFDPMPYERTGPGLARDGLLKFDLERFNSQYFDRLRERVQKAAARGIYVSVMFFEAWGMKWATPEMQPWDYHVYNPENNVNVISDNPLATDGNYAGNYIKLFSMDCPALLEAQKAFVRKVVDTVNDLDNVLYEICNEIPFTPEAMAWQEHLCGYVREYERTKPKQHMIGITPEGGEQRNEDLFATSADWISPSTGRAFEYRYNPPAASGDKVILSDTDHLWGFGYEVPWIWKSFTRGLNVLLMDPWDPIPGNTEDYMDGDVTSNHRYFYAWDDMRRSLGYARKIALRFDLNKLVPDTSFCTSTYCLANRNEQYVCYFPSGGTEGFDLTGLDGVIHCGMAEPGDRHHGERGPPGSQADHETFHNAKRDAARAV